LSLAEEPFDFIALLVEGTMILPRLDAIGLVRDNLNHAEVENQLPGRVKSESFAGRPLILLGNVKSLPRMVRAGSAGETFVASAANRTTSDLRITLRISSLND
jgi:hypothetical protein